MKSNRSINRIRIALWSLAVAFLIALLTLPVLAKGIAHISGNPIQPEKLDVRPIPVPVPPTSLAGNEPSVSATPAPLLVVADPIPVPTPPASATQTTPLIAEDQMTASSAAMTVPIANPQEFLAMALILIALLIWVWSHKAPSFRSLNKEHA